MLNVVILGPNEGGALTVTEFASLGPAQKGLAELILRYLHERHIGITPSLAAALAAQFASDENDARGNGPWAAAFQRLKDGLIHDEDSNPWLFNPAVWNFVPIQLIVAQIVGPVIRKACEIMQICILFGPVATGDASDEAWPRDSYENYDRDLRETVAAQLEDIDQMGRPFWRRAAMAAYGAVKRRAGQESVIDGTGRPPQALPEPDGTLLEFLHRLEPLFGQPPKRPPLRQQTVRSEHDRQGIRPKEGGVEGIRQTRSLEDLGDALISEFMVPPAIFADRLANDGYLARHRPPLRRPKRDVLVVGMMPGVRRSDSDRFAKAAWIEAMFRVALLFKRAGLERSEMRWVEAVGGHGLSIASAMVDHVPLPENADPWDFDRAMRDAFVRDAGWMPTIVDRLPTHALPFDWTGPASDGASVADQAPWLKHAFAESWRSVLPPVTQRESQGRDSSLPVLRLEDYAAVLALVFLPDPSTPSEIYTPDWRHERARIFASLDLSGNARHKAALCVCARRPVKGKQWRFFSGLGSNATTEIGFAGDGSPRSKVTQLNTAFGDVIIQIADLALEVAHVG